MRLTVATAVACLMTAGLSVAGPAAAAVRKSTSIEAQGLAPALQAFAKDRDIQIVYRSELIGDLQTVGAVGELTTEEALTRLLSGTGLTYQHLDDTGITIVPASTAAEEAAYVASNRSLLGRLASWKFAQTDEGGGSSSASEGDSIAKPAGEELTQITITASSTRLNRRDVPTPLFTLDEAQLREAGRTNVVSALNDRPQFRNSVSPQSTGTGAPGRDPGVWRVDQRGLGVFRTLPLVDGHRFVGDPDGSDLSTIPSVLIDRVDVVTGSASAAWGSNAVAGVVNFIMNDRLEGMRVGAQYGVSSRGDNEETVFEAAWGGGFAGGRGHFVIGGEFVDNKGIGVAPESRPELTSSYVVLPNPAYTPTNGQRPNYVERNNPLRSSFDSAASGVIATGVNAGMLFNPDGTLRPADFGPYIPPAGFVVPLDLPSSTVLGVPLTRHSAMGLLTYDLTDSVKLKGRVWHANVYGETPNIAYFSPTAIQIGNAFLSQTIRDQMTAAGQTSFLLGRYDTDFAYVHNDFRRGHTQADLTLEGKLAGDWTWNAYYGHGQYDNDANYSDVIITANYAKAADSVISPATSQPACRVNADGDPANDDSACVPINLFGINSPSGPARDYVLGNAWRRVRNTLDTVGFSVRGDPFELPAGAVSAVAGLEGRREKLEQRVDSLSASRAFWRNQTPIEGSNTTQEAFAEVLAPIVKDLPLLQRLALNAAARWTDDKTDSIVSWKVGLIDDVAEGLQVRASTSRDIRAPNFVELYSPVVPGTGGVFDPVTGVDVVVTTLLGGNVNLRPEASRTTTAGFTFLPRFVPNLSLSVDYFDIEIEDAIATISLQNVVNLCQSGTAVACDAITRNSSGVITSISASQLNFAGVETAGFDVSLNYTLPLDIPGAFRIRTDLTRTTKYEVDNGFSVTDSLGFAGQAFGQGVPELLGSVALLYEADRFRGSLRMRYVDSVKAQVPTELLTIQNPSFPSFAYVDAGVAVTLPSADGTTIQLIGNVTNLLDEKSPLGSGAWSIAYYDAVGRNYSIGLKAQF